MGWEIHFYVIGLILLSLVTESQVTLSNNNRTGGEKQHPHPPALQGFAKNVQ